MSSFGWSAGDVLLAIKVIKHIHDAFYSAQNAKTQYRDALQFLQALEANLHLVHSYLQKSLPQRDDESAVAIERSLGLVRREWERFYDFLKRKYDLSDDAVEMRRGKFKRVFHTMDWGLRELGEKVGEMRRALTEALNVLGLYLAYEMKYAHTTTAM